MYKTLLLSTALWLCALPLSAQLNGTYTIGGTAPHFTTFSAAAAALATQGISGNVTFKVRAGLYPERFDLNSIPGSNTNRRVVFESESSDSSAVRLYHIPGANNNSIVSLQNVGQVTFRYLSFAVPSTGAYGFLLGAYNCANLHIENCAFSGVLTGTINSDNQNILGVGGNSPGFELKNCVVRGGFRAVSISGLNTNNPLPNGLITGNRFWSAASHALRIFYVNNLEISENWIEDQAGKPAYVGLEVQDSKNIRIVRNTIRKGAGTGINLYNCTTTANNRGLIANNMISIGGTNSEYAVTGIKMSGVRFTDLWYNSLNIFDGGTGQHYGIYLDEACRFLNIQNNSIVGRPGCILLREVPVADLITTYSHCNLYNGDAIPNLPLNSISLNPNYVSNTDLHVTNVNLNNLGTPVAVLDDIDDDLRDPATPDIGADEYTPSLLSAGLARFIDPTAQGIYCDSLPLTVALNNSGTVLLTQATMEIQLNGTTWTTVNWTGNLASGQSQSIPLGQLPLSPLTASRIVVTVRQPNGLPDAFSADDQLIFENAYAGFSGAYTIGGQDGNFPSLTAAFEALRYGGLCGPTELLLRNGTYTEQIYLTDSIKGSGPLRQISLRGESGDSSAVRIVAPGTSQRNTTFRLDRMTFFRLKSLTIQQTASTDNFTALFINGGHDLAVENCVITGLGSKTKALTAAPDSNLRIQHCAIRAEGVAASLLSSNIKYNLVFTDNEIGSGDDGMYLQAWRNVIVQRNKISAFSNNSISGLYGTQIRDFDLRDNRIRVTGPQASYGIYLIQSGRYAQTCTLANNAIAMNLGIGIVAISKGLQLINCDHVAVLHNSVFHLSNDADNYAFFIQQSGNITLLNNLFVNGATGRAFYSFGNSDLVSDYNVFFSKSGTLGEIANDLPGLQLLTGGDSHSVIADPGWTLPEPDSLLLYNPALENIATATTITTDLRGWPRQLPTPDPGAYEMLSAPKVQLGKDTSVCGSLLLLGGTPGAVSYTWNTGSTQPDLLVDSSGTYILTAFNAAGEHSDTIQIEVAPIPDTPVIVWENQLLTTVATGQLQWWLDGNLLAGATNDTLAPMGDGAYQVQVTSPAGCNAWSEILNIQVTGNSEIELPGPVVFPNPVVGQVLYVRGFRGIDWERVTVRVIDCWGRGYEAKVVGVGVELPDLPGGAYLLWISEGQRVVGRVVFVKG